RLHLVDGDAAALIELEVQQPPQGMGLGRLVHQGGILLEGLVAALPDGLLQQQDGPGVVHVVLLVRAGPQLVDAGGVQRGVVAQAQGIEGLAVVPLHALLDLRQADALHPAD
ncbi:SnoaL-like domain-containing protein, partial [Dysosmobacter welbionis]